MQVFTGTLFARIEFKNRSRIGLALSVLAGMALTCGVARAEFAQSDLASASATGEVVESEYDRLTREGAECVVASEWVLAFKTLNAAIELEPDRPEAYYTYGRAHQLRGEYPAAERAFRKLLEIEPELAEAWYSLAKLMVVKGELNKAVEYNRNAIDFADPKNWRYYTFLGELYAEMELKASAEQAFDDAAKLLRELIEPLQLAITDITGEVDVYEISQESIFVPNMYTQEIEEFPSVRYQYQSRSAPEEMVDRLARLEAELAAVEARKAEVLAWMESG